MDRRAACAILLACLVGAWGCSKGPPVRTPGPVRVVATIPPLAGLVRPLLPAGGTVQALIPPNRSEHGYELSANDVAALASADVVVYVGLGLDSQVEAFLKKHPNPARKDICFATVAGIIQTEQDHDHHEGHEEEEHHHAGADPHLWLDPDQCIKLIPALAVAIGSVGGAPVSTAADALAARIKEFDAESRARLAPFKGRALVTHHSAWGRLADHYGLTVAAVIKPIESAEENSAAVDEVIRAIREQGIKEILVEPQFSDRAAQRIAEQTGVRVGRLDPLGDGDWFKMMRANIDAIAGALGR